MKVESESRSPNGVGKKSLVCRAAGVSWVFKQKKSFPQKPIVAWNLRLLRQQWKTLYQMLGRRPPRCLAALAVGSVMSESAATAWIIERLEIENTKMEEEMGNMDACEEDSAGGNSGATPLWEGLWSSLPLFHFLRRERYRAHATLNLLLNLLSEGLSKRFDYVGLNFLVPRHRNTSNQHQAYEIYLCS